MTSTNYYVVHKSGRRIKIMCIGYMHSAETREETRKLIAKVEHGRPKDYHVESEKENEGNKNQPAPLFTL